jgi:histidine triad (HIT) family protein
MSSEVLKAQAATDTGEPTIFDKIINREIPADVVHEDEHVRTVPPYAPAHAP